MPMKRLVNALTSGRRQVEKIGALLVALLLACSLIGARAVVFPKTSTPGAYEKYSLRVMNERDIPTLQVEINFPAGLRVVSFADVPGWKLQVLTDSTQRITGAVWRGVLERQHFVEFPFLALNPKDSISLSWPTYQTYEGGERVEWTSPDTTSKTPVSTTLVSEAIPLTPVKVSRTSLYISIIGLLFALTALGVALRPRGVDVNP
jgi:uncharacterized protein YcnI